VIPPNLQTTLDKSYVDESDRRDLGSDTSGPISNRTRRKSKPHGSAIQTPGGGYDESDSAETGVPSDDEVDDATSGDVAVSASGRRLEGRATSGAQRGAAAQLCVDMPGSQRKTGSSRVDSPLVGRSTSGDQREARLKQTRQLDSSSRDVEQDSECNEDDASAVLDKAVKVTRRQASWGSEVDEHSDWQQCDSDVAVRQRRLKVPAAQPVTGKPVSDALSAKLTEFSGNQSTKQKQYINRKPLKQVYYRSREAERNRPVQQTPAVRGYAAGDAQVVPARNQKSANKSSAAGKIGYRVESSTKTATGPSSVGRLGQRKQYPSRYDDSSDSETESGGSCNRHNYKRAERKDRDTSKENARRETS